MIKLADERIIVFIDWLNKNYGINETVLLTVLHGYDVVDDGTNKGFAVYDPDNKIILISGNMPKNFIDMDIGIEFFYHNIAHEYMHHIQSCTGKLNYSEDNEEEADLFADKVVDIYLQGE
jgi:hypothetical protein